MLEVNPVENTLPAVTVEVSLVTKNCDRTSVFVHLVEVSVRPVDMDLVTMGKEIQMRPGRPVRVSVTVLRDVMVRVTVVGIARVGAVVVVGSDVVLVLMASRAGTTMWVRQPFITTSVVVNGQVVLVRV